MASKYPKCDPVKIKALKYDGSYMPESQKFSIDPQITTFEVLHSILSKAFDIEGEFILSYRVLDDFNQETYLPMLSDWDLEASIASASNPCLCIRIDMTYKEPSVKVISENIFTPSSWFTDSGLSSRLHGLLIGQVGKTFNLVRGALNFIEEGYPSAQVSEVPPRPPVTDAEFRSCLDPVGQLRQCQRLKTAIFYGGIEPSLRKVLWKHLLNVYPRGLSGKQRLEYMRDKSAEYEQLRDAWKNVLHFNDQVAADLKYVTNMVRKDVLRTDRHHKCFAGNDDNKYLVSLYNILATYALNHPSVKYCQGMSDLASPLLVTMEGDEAQAYICFCALMRRLRPNFMFDGSGMTKRFQHLSDGLSYYDPQLYSYLKSHQAVDLLFCYRWLLLEMKREFAFEDALRMLEVMWSSLPTSSDADYSDLKLYEVKFGIQSHLSPSNAAGETHYSKICALRRRTSAGATSRISCSLDESAIAKRRLRSKSREDAINTNSVDDATLRRRVPTSLNFSSSSEYSSSTCSSCSDNSSSFECKSPQPQPILQRFNSLRRFDAKTNHELTRSRSLNFTNNVVAPAKVIKNLNEFLNLDRNGNKINKRARGASDALKARSPPDSPEEYHLMTTSITRELDETAHELDRRILQIDEHPVVGEEIFINEIFDDVTMGEDVDDNINENSEPFQLVVPVIDDKITRSDWRNRKTKRKFLPAPEELAGGNPFLIFVCVTIFQQHRDVIMKNGMDYNEMAMYFDKMVRKHNLNKVLNQARVMYRNYLKSHSKDFFSYGV